MTKRAIFKYIFLFTLSVVFWMGILGLVKTEKALAYYNDEEGNPANSFIAGPLDFYLTSVEDFAPEITPTQPASRDINLFNSGNPFRYKIETTEVSGDLCSFINLEADLDGGAAECSGNLIGFICEEFIFALPDGADPHQWHLIATLTEGAPEEAVCVFKILYSGRQIELDTGGFHDEEEIESTINSGIWLPEVQNIVINKVYYDVDENHGAEITNEWLELYNPNDVPVDISAWFIEDNFAQNMIPSAPPLPAYGFALVTGNSSTWGFWDSVPSSAIKIVLFEGKIGDGLDNEGDRVILKDSFGRTIDQMSYEGDTSIFNPAPPLDGGGNPYNLPEGHILGRKPTGYDTDSASDWKDFGLPQVTVVYPSGGETWYGYQLVNLRWEAFNPNGLSDDLAITLLYIRDLDGNGVISDGDAVSTIAEDIPNTGSYVWQVSPCHYGYVWIKVIARGPENFMISGSDTSGRVFEPPAPENLENTEEIMEAEATEMPEVSEIVDEVIDEGISEEANPPVDDTPTVNETGEQSEEIDEVLPEEMTAPLEETESQETEEMIEETSENEAELQNNPPIEDTNVQSNPSIEGEASMPEEI